MEKTLRDRSDEKVDARDLLAPVGSADQGPANLEFRAAFDERSRVRDGQSADFIDLKANLEASGNGSGNGRANSRPSVTLRPAAHSPQFNRSRVTNGRDLLPGIDGRSAWARRFRDLIDGLTADLGSVLSEAERLQVRTAASLQLHVEQLTAQMVRGEAVDPDAITRAANGATRALSALKRRGTARGPAPASLATYLAAKAGGAS